MPVGAALLVVPGPPVLAVAGLLTVGFAAAPIFPLFTLTTAQQIGTGGTGTGRVVGLQVAAPAIGGSALPAGTGVAFGALDGQILGPLLLARCLAMLGLHRLSRLAGS